MRAMTMARTLRRRPAAGMSLLEVLIAAALLLTISLAVLPMFLQATKNNISGRDSATMSSYGGEIIETAYPLSFNSPQLSVAVGTTETTSRFYWVSTDLKLGEGDWVPDPGTMPPDTLYGRTRTVRQFGLADIYDNRMLDAPLDGGTPMAFIQLKEVVMVLDGRGGGSQWSNDTPDQPFRRMILRYYKSF